jgi:inner membrane protein
MPSPIAHLGTGYAIYRYYKHQLPQHRGSTWLLALQVVLVMGLSMLPDLDVILAFIFGDMEKYHNNFSHSIFLAFPVALICAVVFQRLYRSKFWLWFLVSFVSYSLHVLLDMFTGGRGVMLFWPLTQARYNSPVALFYGVQWGLGWFSIWHLWTIFTEALFALLLIGTVYLLDMKRSRGIIAQSAQSKEQ